MTTGKNAGYVTLRLLANRKAKKDLAAIKPKEIKASKRVGRRGATGHRPNQELN